MGQVAGALICIFIGWSLIKNNFMTNKILAKENLALYFSVRNGLMGTFAFLVGFAFLLAGVAVVGITGKEAYEGYKIKSDLKASVIRQKEVAMQEYQRIKVIVENLPPEKREQNMPTLIRAKSFAEEDIQQNFKIIDEHTADSLQRYGLKSDKLEKEITIGAAVDMLKQYGF